MDNEINGTFAERHPRINMIIALIVLILMVLFATWFLGNMVKIVQKGFDEINFYLKNFVSNTDKLIVVAMITGSVSIVGVVISSIVARIVEYRFNVKKYLFDKREQPYEQFISMVYKTMEDSNKPDQNKMSEEDMISMVSEFSKGLTLWGSNRVVKKWLKYRKQSIKNGGAETLILMEDIIYEIRRDVGLGRRLKKGDMLSFFINDIETLIKK
ncbi:hypothetical protein [Anaerocolumna sp.]|uniref:hypothetical protein n=1 Tax=Anaerocolumna sp. TaxID=2041569 RepID=UPI0028A6B36B|nr:hypothetical protein [Anaerocolumna sp.]